MPSRKSFRIVVSYIMIPGSMRRAVLLVWFYKEDVGSQIQKERKLIV